MYTVYIHKNKINQKVYVGLTKQSPQARWRVGGHGYKKQPKFWEAIEKYGWDNFEHIILSTGLTAEEASQLEKKLIQSFDSIQNGYNIDEGGIIHSPSQETIEKIRVSMKGKTHTLETKEKISLSKEKDKKPVICVETGIEYESAASAMKHTGVDRSSISKVCYGTMNTAGGYHWYFKGEKPIYLKDKRLKPVMCIDTGKIYSSTSEAARDTNSDPSNIKKVCDGKYKTTNKLRWKYYQGEFEDE